MYHSTRSECPVLIKSTIVRSVRATSSSLRSRAAQDQCECRVPRTPRSRRDSQFAPRAAGAQIKSLPQQEGADPQGRLTCGKDLGCFHALTSLTAQKAFAAVGT